MMPSHLTDRARELRREANQIPHGRGDYWLWGETRRVAKRASMVQAVFERAFRVRIVTGFTAIIVLTLAIASWSFYHISQLGGASEHLFIENYRTIRYMQMTELAMTDLVHAPAAQRPSLDSVVRANLQLEFANITEPGERTAANQAQTAYLLFLENPNEQTLAAARAACETVLQLNERAMFARSLDFKAQGEFARSSTLAITIVLVALAVLLAVAVSRRSLAEYQELDRAKSNFVATAAHELKNPLASIKTTSGLLCDGIAGPLTQKQHELVENVHHESERLLVLVRELLDLARLEAGTMQLHLREVDPETLIESAIFPIALRAEAEEVAIDTFVSPHLSMLTVDANKIAWAITNLLSNAIRYSPRGSSIQVCVTDSNAEIWISVRDHGKGIAENDLKRIFEKFVQVEEMSMGGVSGSGLGLSIAREIVLLHHGRIWATSTVGGGSTFTIALPKGTRRSGEFYD